MSLSKVQAKILAAKKKREERLAAEKAKAEKSFTPKSALAKALESSRKANSTSSTPATNLNKNQVTLDNLNPQQLQAVELATGGDSFCLIGSAGTGKTTTVRTIATELLNSGKIGHLKSGTKNISVDAPSICFVSFTNVAVKNIREALPEEFKSNALTIHKLLEYHPEFYEIEIIEDGIPTGEYRKTMRYEPRYGINAGLLPEFTHCVIEEAGSVPTNLFAELKAALPLDVSYIFLGDLQQLPPAFGDGSLGYKMIEYPIVELTQVYRQALNSPIIELAYRVLKGRAISDKELLTFNKSTPEGEVKIQRFAKYIDHERMLPFLGAHYAKLVNNDEFQCGKDVILCPYNVGLGTIELNKYIAQARAEKDGCETYEVISGFEKHYFCIGDHIMFLKQNWIITNLQKNVMYTGPKPLAESYHLDRWGMNRGDAALEEADFTAKLTLDDADAMLSLLGSSDSKESIVQQASHILTLENMDTGEIREIKTSGEINDTIFTYALTVHKSQGSEWDKVYFLMHHKHGHMANRELLYTAITRARKQLIIQYDGEHPTKLGNSIFQKGVVKQQIKGKTIADKLQYFKAKLEAMELERRA